MASETDPARIPLPGSLRPLPAPVGVPLDPAVRVELTVLLRPAPDSAPLPEAAARLPGSTPEGGPLSRVELAAARRPDPQEFAAFTDYARAAGLELRDADPGRRRIVLAGPAAAISAAFGVELLAVGNPAAPGPGTAAAQLSAGVPHAPSGPATLPARLAASVAAVLGLDTRPVATPRVVVRTTDAGTAAYLPATVAALYGLPAGARAAGEFLGVLELGGGYSPGDLETFFTAQGLPVPRVVDIGVDGATNSPGNSADVEVTLDLQMAGSVAVDATLVCYFAPNTERGFVDAVLAAVEDQSHAPNVLSISWGGPEDTWSPAARTSLEQALADAAAVGMTVCVAAGDQGSSDGVPGSLAHVDFPAASPAVLGCGGTRLETAAEQIVSEVVWNDLPNGGATGGGVSAVYPVPGWQARAGVPPSANPGSARGRGVPDVAGDADPDTGYSIVVGGQKIVVGGTSAVAPLWAGLVAIANARLGRALGFLNPWLYSAGAAAQVCRDVVSGCNPAYCAGPGWDACSGWGSPDVPRLFSALDPAGAATVATSAGRPPSTSSRHTRRSSG